MTLLALVLAVSLGMQAAESPQLPTLILPPADGAWVVRVVTTGGFTGRGSGNFTANSAGELVCLTVACPGRLASDSLRTLSRLVPTVPLPGNVTPPSSPFQRGVCSDCISTIMTVRRRAAAGEQMASYAWDESTRASVPEAVLRLHTAIVTLAETHPTR